MHGAHKFYEKHGFVFEKKEEVPGMVGLEPPFSEWFYRKKLTQSSS